VTSYTRGINGVIIEFDGILPGPLTTGDVTFAAAPADARAAFSGRRPVALVPSSAVVESC